MNYSEFRQRYSWNAKTDKLGEGGFGKVYRATDTLRSRFVVLKIADVPTKHKFSLQREVELNRDLTPHPNIAQYRNCYRLENDHGEECDYATMDYFPDGSLTNVMTRPIGPDDLYDIVSGMLHGLAHLEREQVIHRDFKPGNVLMARDEAGRWLPKIADFGLSRFTSTDNTVSNSSVGISYDYAVPEQFRPGLVNRQADLWSFGVIVYRLSTGKLPFTTAPELIGESRRLELIRLIDQAQLPADTRQIAEPYQTIICWCLVKELNQRVRSADELLPIMERVLEVITEEVPKYPGSVYLLDPAVGIPESDLEGKSDADELYQKKPHNRGGYRLPQSNPVAESTPVTRNRIIVTVAGVIIAIGLSTMKSCFRGMRNHTTPTNYSPNEEAALQNDSMRNE